MALSQERVEKTEIDVCVLPKATQKELIVFENNLQIATDFKQEYGPVNDRLRLRDMKEEKFTYKEIESSLHGRWNSLLGREYVGKQHWIYALHSTRYDEQF